MQVVLLGPPGVGKGTQAARLSAARGIAHISTGDMFRDNVLRGTELGKTANTYMTAGDLVPDSIVIAMVEDRLSQPDCQMGFLLDGFPRTLPQAESLDELLVKIGRPLVAVVDLEADEEELVRRLSGRRVCGACGATYHVDNSPPAEGSKCDKCGGEVVQRKDDRAEAIRRRLVEYHDKTAALTGYYRGRGLLESIDGLGSIEEVLGRVNERLDSRVADGKA